MFLKNLSISGPVKMQLYKLQSIISPILLPNHHHNQLKIKRVVTVNFWCYCKRSWWKTIEMRGNLWAPGGGAEKTYVDTSKKTCRFVHLPVDLFGDFNKILNLNEKTSGNDRNLSMVVAFRETVRECNLTNLNMSK